MKRQHLLSSQEVVLASTCRYFYFTVRGGCKGVIGEIWIGIGGCSFHCFTAGGGVIVVGCSSTLNPAANLSIAGGI